jgi:hypothetical protein
MKRTKRTPVELEAKFVEEHSEYLGGDDEDEDEAA